MEDKDCEVCTAPLEYQEVAVADFDGWIFKIKRNYLPCAYCAEAEEEERSA